MNREKLMRKTLLDRGDIAAPELAKMDGAKVKEAFTERYAILRLIAGGTRYADDGKAIVVPIAELERFGEPVELD